MKEDQLKCHLGFDDKDLLANRNGRLSEKQSRRRKSVDDWTEKFVLGLFLFFLAGGLLLAFFAVRAMTSIQLWVWTVVVLAMAGWLYRGVRNKVDDSVQKAQGRMEFIKVERLSSSPTDSMADRQVGSGYEMRIGGEAFNNANPALTEHCRAIYSMSILQRRHDRSFPWSLYQKVNK